MKAKKFFAAAAGAAAAALTAVGAKVFMSNLKGGSGKFISLNNTDNNGGAKPEEKSGGVDFKEFSDEILTAMIDSFEKKTPYSGGHSRRVAEISRLIGEKLGFSDLNGLYYAALLHDVGKMYIPEELLNKSKFSMTDLEKEEWYNHPKTGAALVKGISGISRYAGSIKHHHERYDGSGYPDGLKGEDIPLASRIIAVADAYEAMSSERPGREAYPREYIMRELTKCSGNQFDPAVAKAMMAVIADIETQRAQSAE
ncbi:MAG TPA: HD domain-containing protein [Candidatus Monoglobus merdigallinarum]|uniref:HD domain-containing protein n=1 Tax=Candidatus Monoglobus merdigallinarum TaxID=2838698 RepID=A0A9D1PQ36_9FIRM|nr:HD domain-containing protein [Candidatus Monoglobus merdigallinarum]